MCVCEKWQEKGLWRWHKAVPEEIRPSLKHSQNAAYSIQKFPTQRKLQTTFELQRRRAGPQRAVVSSSLLPLAFFSLPVTPSGTRRTKSTSRFSELRFNPVTALSRGARSPWSASPAQRSVPPRWRPTSRRPRGVWWVSPPRPRSAPSPCWTGRAPVPAATPQPHLRPARTGAPPALEANPHLRPKSTRSPRTINWTARRHLPSLSHSHLSSHLSIMSFLLSVNWSNFSLICEEERFKSSWLQ